MNVIDCVRPIVCRERERERERERARAREPIVCRVLSRRETALRYDNNGDDVGESPYELIV